MKETVKISDVLSVRHEPTRIRIDRMNPFDQTFETVFAYDSRDARAIAAELLKWADEYDKMMNPGEPIMYEGVWSGYGVTVTIDGQKWVIATKDGLKGFTSVSVDPSSTPWRVVMPYEDTTVEVETVGEPTLVAKPEGWGLLG